MDIMDWKVVGALKRSEDLDEAATEWASRQLKTLEAEEKLMLCRTRKYRLFPTQKQCYTLRRFMGTCRWTYNQTVAHFRETNVYKASTLRELNVTRDYSLERTYPLGMEPPPEWTHEMPSSIRGNTMRKFAANVKSGFSNKANGKISRFHIRFKSKKGNPLTMFAVNARDVQITDAESDKALLSIPGLQDIPIHYDRNTVIISEMQIVVEGGDWYAVIPTFVDPPKPDFQGGCIALDPGIHTFLTGVDLSGSAVEIGGNNVDRMINEMQPVRTHLERSKMRANQAQHDLAVLPEVDGRRMREPSMRFPVRTPRRKTASRIPTTRRARI